MVNADRKLAANVTSPETIARLSRADAKLAVDRSSRPATAGIAVERGVCAFMISRRPSRDFVASHELKFAREQLRRECRRRCGLRRTTTVASRLRERHSARILDNAEEFSSARKSTPRKPPGRPPTKTAGRLCLRGSLKE